jgi:prephenate dehydrogenase
MRWRKISLIGVGLLGGSLGLAIKQRRLAERVEGYVRREISVAECEGLGALDKATLDLGAAVQDADLVVLCTPIAQMRPLTEEMTPALSPGTLITDVGSVKGSVVQELEPLVSRTGAHFVGSHPMAGAEKTGVKSARADLFVGAICAITPTAASDPQSVERLEGFWKDVGAVPLRLAAELHDELVSRSSHLPHVLASQLARFVLNSAHPKEQALLCANGFRDTTRIASGSPEMWRDICLANRHNLARVIEVFIEDLRRFHHLLEMADSKGMETFLREAKERRDAWGMQGPSPSPE